MCEFVSWLEPIEDEILAKYGGIGMMPSSMTYIKPIARYKGDYKHPDPLFLTDEMMWHTSQGKKLIEYDGGLNEESTANGHGAIKKYYGLSDSGFRKCYRIQCQNFSDPDNFPKEIVKAIKNFKMIRMSKGCSDWQYMLGLLTEEKQAEVRADWRKYQCTFDANNFEKIQLNETTTDSLEFKKFVSKKLIKEVKEKLHRIITNKEAGIGYMYGGSDSILQWFNWHSTNEGKIYWYNINAMNIFKDRPKLKQPKKDFSRYYWHELIWELFKDPKFRNPLWM